MKEYLQPQHDWVLLRAIEHEDVSKGGIVMAKPGDYTNLKTDRERREHRPDRENTANQQTRRTDRYEVLSVGPGVYTDIADEVHDKNFLRKPMCCFKGDTVVVQNGAFPIPVNGEILYLCHDYLILAKVLDAGTSTERLDPQHDYIFSKPSDGMQKSAGGIILPHESDQTGNKAMPDRWEALGVGDGPWCLKTELGKPTTFARRPMDVAVGDQFTFEGGGFMVNAGGAPVMVCQNYQVAGVFKAVL